MKTALFIFSGLPGSGKSTLAKRLAAYYHAAYLRIDTIEQGLRDLCHFNVQGEGYRLAYRIAKDNLVLGNHVIADSCNPIQLTRDEWEETALQSNALPINIEIICSDKTEHKKRVETRISEVPDLILPTWEEIQNREYHPWNKEHVIIDTAGLSVDKTFQLLITSLEKIIE